MQQEIEIEQARSGSQVEPVKVELPIGYTDKQGFLHRSVTIGQRVNGRMLFDIDSDPAASLQTQYNLLLLRATITEFGSLMKRKSAGREVFLPVPLLVLISLNTVDLDILDEAQALFSARGMESRESKHVSESTLKLYFGYGDKASGAIYDMVEFGNQTTGRDLIEADRRKLSPMRRLCFLDGLLVSKISTSDGALELPGPLGLEIFEHLDMADIFAIRSAAEVWRSSFRERGKELRRGSSASGGDNSDKNRLE
jgi:hypothetical protein